MAQSVGRAIDILEFCSETPRSLKQLADMLGVHRSTAFRIAQTLADAGFVRRNLDGTYGVGFRLAGLAKTALDNFDLRTVVHPHIERLGAKIGFTIQFAVAQGSHIIYVDKIEPQNSISLNTKIGGFVVIHTAGVSKAILAFLEPKQVDQILANATFEKLTASTITTRDGFLRRLVEVRKNGWASDRGEYETISNCIAAPVRDYSNMVVGAISITAFREVADIDRLVELLPDLIETTTAVSKELGWNGLTEETSSG
ncbi:IclR family transcriptional regulator [Acidisoma cellulosilytica]|uniref:IclR family transcriptional regulator n=1 Tax=Acidisoma cellulosilyticum TaxID=2802395 RepID=A0A963Z4Z4_9PROT|nr:IclR family transcriptional regulator [Acidisoma cellulosilyticum]MCB8882621.1 IclR family transcriptional regulator [Acidisoma cellulosilyticum]